MVVRTYLDRLEKAMRGRSTHAGIVLAPRVSEMPLEIARYDDPFLPYSKAVIEAVRDRICVVVFDMAAFLAVGAAGAVALERAIAFARSDGETCAVLHMPCATEMFASAMSDAAFAVDAITVTDVRLSAAYAAVNVATYVFGSADRKDAATYDAGSARLFHAELPHLDVRLVVEEVMRSARREDYLEIIRTEVERINSLSENRSDE